MRHNLEPLRSLDLNKCNTVGEIVNAMKHCSFGARMLGEVANTLCTLVKRGEPPVVVYDGVEQGPLWDLLNKMTQKGWLKSVRKPEEYYPGILFDRPVLVIGFISEKYRENIFNTKRAIFINEYGFAKPGQVKDGFFPNVVFSDPRYIMPILYDVMSERIDGKAYQVKDLIANIEKYGGMASEVAHGASTFKTMVEDPDCTVFLTLSGAMTIAKMSLIICDLLDHGMVQHLASTGALMAHGFIESLGLKHYKYNPKVDDVQLANKGINRVTDTLEPETNFDHVDKILDKILFDLSGKGHISPSIFHEMIGKYLAENYPKSRGILKSAYEKKAMVLVPAFFDSEIGNVCILTIFLGIKQEESRYSWIWK